MRNVFGADEQTELPIDVLRWIGLAELVLAQERVSPDAEVSVIFVDELAITDLNERFLGGTGATDVLAFPMDDDVPMGGRQPDQGGRGPGAPLEPVDPPQILGDVVICPMVALRQAAERHIAVDDEIALLLVHGVLHLLNYDHAEPGDTEKMQAKERDLLSKFRAQEESEGG